jgi:hypothetical protein
MRFSLRRDILNKDVPTGRQEPRRPSGRAFVNKVISPLYVSIPSLSFNSLPHNAPNGDSDTRIWHAESTQEQAFGSCANRNTPLSTRVPWTSLTFHSFRSKFHHYDLASSTSHVDDPQESLRALQESADAFPIPNPYLKSAVSGVSALWQTAKVGQSVAFYKGVSFTKSCSAWNSRRRKRKRGRSAHSKH